jgi:SAM-dependent methyltransferase
MTPPLLTRLFPNDLHHVEGLHTELTAALPHRGRVLDLGCGVNTDLAPYRNPECEVWGADFQRHPDLRHAEWFRQLGEGGTIPFPDGHFDLIAGVMVLEHVADADGFFREVNRVLRPSGRFVGHTISGCHYVTWVRRLIGLLPHTFNQALVRRLYGRPDVDTFPAFYRLNRLGQIERACRRTGLRVTSVRRYADPGYFNFSRALGALAVMTDWSLEKVAAGFGRLYFTITLEKGSRVGEIVPPGQAGRFAAPLCPGRGAA